MGYPRQESRTAAADCLEVKASVPSFDAYASLLRYGDLALVAKNSSAAHRGYHHIKLHEVTREAVLAAKNAPGVNDTSIMLDVNCAWPVLDAVKMSDALRDDGLTWLEEPVFRRRIAAVSPGFVSAEFRLRRARMWPACSDFSR